MRKTLLAIVALITVLGGSVAIASLLTHSSAVLAKDKCDSSGPGGGNCNDDDGDDTGDDHGNHDEPGDDHGQDVVTTAVTAVSPQGNTIVTIENERFSSSTITIRAGQSVTFVNNDDDEHTATGPGFDTGIMQPGDSVTITFDTPGRYDFVCQFHSHMRGTVVVTDAGSPVASPAASPVVLTPLATAPSSEATAPVAIQIADFSFSQPQLTVRPGTTVTWTNTGAAPHTVSGLPTDSGTIEPGQSFSYTFDTAGAFKYACAFHAQMTGEVIVDPNAPTS